MSRNIGMMEANLAVAVATLAMAKRRKMTPDEARKQDEEKAQKEADWRRVVEEQKAEEMARAPRAFRRRQQKLLSKQK